MNEQLINAMKTRHTVRKFDGASLSFEDKKKLEERAALLNSQLDLSILLVESEKTPLNMMGKVMLGGQGVNSYYILAADDREGVDETLGYASSDLVLYAQSLGLNTWWIGGTFNRKTVSVSVPGKKVVGIVAVGHGLTQGVPHKSKTPDQVSSYTGEAPKWFKDGVDAALLAPTALNRQLFTIKGEGNKVSLTYKSGPMSDIDRGIVKHHFELGAGKENFEWA